MNSLTFLWGYMSQRVKLKGKQPKNIECIKESSLLYIQRFLVIFSCYLSAK